MRFLFSVRFLRYSTSWAIFTEMLEERLKSVIVHTTSRGIQIGEIWINHAHDLSLHLSMRDGLYCFALADI